jgi:hypothetical protein
VDTEFKPGVDGLRLDLPLSEVATFTLVGVVGRTGTSKNFDISADGSAVLPRVDLTLGTTRVGVMAGWVRRDVVCGADLFVDLGSGADFHAEATVTHVPIVARRPYGHADFIRAAAGFSQTLTAKLHLVTEAYWNGAGAPDVEDYVSELESERFQAGEVYNVGQLYAGASAVWDVHPLVELTATALVNAKDPSALAALGARYNVARNVLLLAGAFLPVGRTVRLNGAGQPEARSEFGLYPFQYYVDAKIYF